MTPEESVVEILHDTGFEIESAEDYAEKYATIKVGKRGSAYVEWGWEEDKQYVSEHCSSSIMEGTSFIKYPKSTSDIIETAYQAWEDSDEEEDNVCEVDLTGCVVKKRNKHTGLRYKIDFAGMAQINKQSKFERSIRREVHFKNHALEAVNSLPCFPVNAMAEDFLPTFQGQVILVTKKAKSCDDMWYYGDVVYDPEVCFEDRPKPGWFPAILCECADSAAIRRALKSRIDADVLKPPETWEAGKDGLVEVTPGSQEYKEVVAKVTSSFNTNHTISCVERIQSPEMWRTYAVKFDAIKTRYSKDPGNLVNNTDGDLESWLFHGTYSTAASKIVSQGFNRVYAGRNGTTLGKGVYFSINASYSERYSTADSNGDRKMFLCRVSHGDFCVGRSDLMVPDPKPGTNELFDSTVDNVTNPTVFVVYHDAQVYPEYLVTFH